MRKIILHSAALDRRGAYRDAGTELTVGAAGNESSDITTDAANELVNSGRAQFVSSGEPTTKAARKRRSTAVKSKPVENLQLPAADTVDATPAIVPTEQK